MFLVDSHCHLDLIEFEKNQLSLDEMLAQAHSEKVDYFLTVSTSLDRFEQFSDWLKERKNIFFSCGQHPLYVNEQYDFERFSQLAKHKNVIALGETGLDFYHENIDISMQRKVFAEHIFLGNKLEKPIIVHTRSAQKETIAILKSENAQNCSGVLHCFTEDIDFARKILDLGFCISFSGIITFKNAESLREVVKFVPLDSLLVETDSPYLAPIPFRGKDNFPIYVKYVAECVAKLKNKSIEEIAQITSENFSRLFNVKFD